MDIEKAMLDPSSQFTKPDEVLAEKALTRTQKIQILRRWEYDARQLEVAEEENMGGNSPSMLGEIINALQLLDAEDEKEHTSPTKQGG